MTRANRSTLTRRVYIPPHNPNILIHLFPSNIEPFDSASSIDYPPSSIHQPIIRSKSVLLPSRPSSRATFILSDQHTLQGATLIFYLHQTISTAMNSLTATQKAAGNALTKSTKSFTDLPGEVRNVITRYALAPGHIWPRPSKIEGSHEPDAANAFRGQRRFPRCIPRERSTEEALEQCTTKRIRVSHASKATKTSATLQRGSRPLPQYPTISCPNSPPHARCRPSLKPEGPERQHPRNHRGGLSRGIRRRHPGPKRAVSGNRCSQCTTATPSPRTWRHYGNAISTR